MLLILKMVVQIFSLSAAALAGNFMARYLHLPIPGSILGFFLVFLLFQLKIIRLNWLEAGANYLIAELILFFIPSTVGIVNYGNLMRLQGVQFEMIIVLSTATVMACVGFAAEYITKYKRRLHIHVNKQ